MTGTPPRMMMNPTHPAAWARSVVMMVKSPAVTRQRLYYETMEEVLGNTNKVLVDTRLPVPDKYAPGPVL